ncbi:hypothetical protein LJR090_002680 [Bosea sp. LjRoot90]
MVRGAAQCSRGAVMLPEKADESTMLIRMIGTPPKYGSFFEAALEWIM